jgi:hypothetical protein
MTARWFSARLGERRKRRVPGASLNVERRRVSHGEGRQSPKVVLISGARDAKRRL